LFARYGLIGSFAAALGALIAAVPDLAVKAGYFGAKPALQAMFVLYGLTGLASWGLYRRLKLRAPAEHKLAHSLGPSRRVVLTLAGLFSLDAFGGGFVMQSMLALWLFERFDMSTSLAGVIFFWAGILSALSYLVAVRIAGRIGLINTMVFTHLPANLMLLSIPFLPHLGWVIVLLLVRSALSQMDVPTRGSYVMAVVSPPERAAAASITAVPRSLASAASPLLAGYLLGISTFGWPLVVAGSIKIVYDVSLLAMFRAVRPPEEAKATL
jgi:predicted MFS family arabinose efflux permease